MLSGTAEYVALSQPFLKSVVCLLCHCRDFFTSPFKVELLDSVVQPTNSGTFIDSFAGFDQKSSGLRSRCQLVLFTYRCQFLIMLESPVQVDSASLAVFGIVLIHSSALWTLCHGHPLSAQFISWSYQTLAYSYCNCMCPVSDLQLPVNILHSAFDRDLAPEQLLADLFIRKAIRCQPH